MQTELETFLNGQGIPYRLLDKKEEKDVRQHWLRCFASKVLKNKGTDIFNGYMWHGFSFEIEESIAGDSALVEYQKQSPAPFVIFDEDGEFCFRCEPGPYPDLTEFGDDLYLAHHNMKWTIAFTHEQPDLGPYFAFPPMVVAK